MAKNYGARNAALHAKMGTVKGRQGVFRSVERMNKPKAVVERKNKNFSYTISDHKGRALKKGNYND